MRLVKQVMDIYRLGEMSGGFGETIKARYRLREMSEGFG